MTQDKKKIEKILQNHNQHMEAIKICLKYINNTLKQLKQHTPSTLKEARRQLWNDSWVIDLAAKGGTGPKAIEAKSKVSGLIDGFALGMDFYFTEGKDGQQKVKKGLESELAKKIRTLAEELRKGLDELQQLKSLFQKN